MLNNKQMLAHQESVIESLADRLRDRDEIIRDLHNIIRVLEGKKPVKVFTKKYKRSPNSKIYSELKSCK